MWQLAGAHPSLFLFHSECVCVTYGVMKYPSRVEIGTARQYSSDVGTLEMEFVLVNEIVQ